MRSRHGSMDACVTASVARMPLRPRGLDDGCNGLNYAGFEQLRTVRVATTKNFTTPGVRSSGHKRSLVTCGIGRRAPEPDPCRINCLRSCRHSRIGHVLSFVTPRDWLLFSQISKRQNSPQGDIDATRWTRTPGTSPPRWQGPLQGGRKKSSDLHSALSRGCFRSTSLAVRHAIHVPNAVANDHPWLSLVGGAVRAAYAAVPPCVCIHSASGGVES